MRGLLQEDGIWTVNLADVDGNFLNKKHGIWSIGMIWSTVLTSFCAEKMAFMIGM